MMTGATHRRLLAPLLCLTAVPSVDAFSLSPHSTSRCSSLRPPAAGLSASRSETTADKYADLLSWVDSFSDSYVNPAVEIKPSPRGGFGAFAARDVAEDELLFSVPREACVTVADATGDGDCGKALQNLLKKAGPGGTTVALAGYLAKEYLRLMELEKKAVQGEEEIKFESYLRTLPWERGINEQEHVLFWSEDDMDTFLKGSLSYDEAVEIRSEVKLAVKVLNAIVGPAVRKYRGEETVNPIWTVLPWEKDKATSTDPVDGLADAVSGAFVNILTRSFATDVFEERLVPLLDMLQHSDKPSVKHSSNDAGGVEVRARFDIMAGDEIYNRYQKEGEDEKKMPNHRFFTRFGFVPDNIIPVRQLLSERNELFYPRKKEI